MFKVIRHYKIWFLLSGGLMGLSLILLFVWGLRAGIDFRGGSLAELEFGNQVHADKISQELTSFGYKQVVVQLLSEKKVIIKTQTLSGEALENFKKLLTEKFGEFTERRFESIGPAISRELQKKAYWQIGLVVSGILLYIAYAFRQVTRETKRIKLSSWRMGVAAIIALLHDLLITLGVFVVLGKFRGLEIDSMFVTALLTILGFSVHDTIVVFDRIRESLQKYPHLDLDQVMDYSVNSTFARSINTSSTLVFVLLAMAFFGGQTIFAFVLALLVGVVVGTYSSIFIASPLLYLWSKNQK